MTTTLVKSSATFVFFCVLGGCAVQPTVPETPQFLAAKDVEMLRITQDRCASSLSGFGDARDLQNALVTAQNRAAEVGSSAEDFANARQLWERRFTAGEVINGPETTCSQMLSGSGKIAAQM